MCFVINWLDRSKGKSPPKVTNTPMPPARPHHTTERGARATVVGAYNIENLLVVAPFAWPHPEVPRVIPPAAQLIITIHDEIRNVSVSCCCLLLDLLFVAIILHPPHTLPSMSFQQAASGRLGWSLFSRGQPYNVVLTHLSADFDSLAAAVGVAKLWNMDDPEV